MSAPSHPIRFGVFTGVAQTTWPDLLEVWQRADEMGFDTGWVPDHFYAGYGDPAGPCFEAGTVLAAVAARTRRIGIGPLVLSNTFRHPAVLANMAASLDHVAEGRFTLGLGAGWLQSEHDGYGLAVRHDAGAHRAARRGPHGHPPAPHRAPRELCRPLLPA